MTLIERAIKRRNERIGNPCKVYTYEENIAYIKECFLSFHGYNGIAYCGAMIITPHLTKDLKVIAVADVTTSGTFTLTLFKADGGLSRQYAVGLREDFEEALIEGMSYHL